MANRLNHGFRSSTVLLPGDDRAEYETLLAELSEHFTPADLTEERLTREMADAEWRLRRVRVHMESAISRHMAKLEEQNPDLHPLDLQSLAIETLADTGCSYAAWLRFQTKFERQYDRANLARTRYSETRRRMIAQAPASPLPAAAASKLASNVHITPDQQDPAGVDAPVIAHNALPLLHPSGLPASQLHPDLRQ